MIRLQPEQLNKKVEFIHDYIDAKNAADGSSIDANANVTHKNIATMESELMKDFFVQVNRTQIARKIAECFDQETANEYFRQIEKHEIYVHDETSLKPYCASITLYPFLLDGLRKLGGESKTPKHLASFCGSFINLVFAVSAQFAGAVATVEFLTYFDHFARQDYGENYLETHATEITNHLQQVIYSINQPAAARGYQSVFWNISVYDSYYFNAIFDNFIFPNGDQPSWNSVDKLQLFFMKWFNQERTKAILTFPVITAAMLTSDGKCKDDRFAMQMAQELSEGNSFFIYQSDNPDSLASCCRLRNEINDRTFSYTLGAGGVATGSINVITLNMNRLEQDGRNLAEEVKKIHRYQYAYRKLMEDYQNAGMLPVYDAGFITLEKQFLTIGINGMAEAAESCNIEVGNNKSYINFVQKRLKIIFEANKRASKHYQMRFNTEFVPAENLGVKNAQWDEADGYVVPRKCYNSYFYTVESNKINALDKFILHGKQLVKWLDGGSALHLNFDETLSVKSYRSLFDIAAKTGCNYFCTNVCITICNKCNHIDKQTLRACKACGSTNIDHGTRIIGYLKRVSAFSSARQKEHSLRHYHRRNIQA